MSEALEEAGLVVNRWRRYGKDRLYISLSDEVKIGWWDLTTDEPHPETPNDLATLTTAVQAWKAVQDTGPSQLIDEVAAGESTVVIEVPRAEPDVRATETGEKTPAVEKPTAERPWIDLATNDAGSAAREQALAAKEAAPVRTLLARALGVHTDERAWRIGAAGEEKVAAQLAKLIKKDPRWRVIHAVPVGTRGSDIDHLIMGPGGVFTANAKHHPGAKIWVGGNTFMVNGNKQPYVRNSRHEAARATELLTTACGFPVHVEGLIVTVKADDVVVKNQPDGVSVVPRMQVTKWLLRHGEVLTTEAIDAIHEAARRSTTWCP